MISYRWGYKLKTTKKGYFDIQIRQITEPLNL